MSWQGYVDNNLIGSGKVSQAAIIGLDGGVWASSPGFQVSHSEVTLLREGFANIPKVYTTGLRFNGVKYVVLKADVRFIYGKDGANGFYCVKTNRTIVLGVNKDGIPQNSCVAVVAAFADFLRNSGY